MSNATAIAVPSTTDPLFHAATFVTRYSGGTRELYTTRLRVFYQWCADHNLDPIHGITRPHLEMYARHLEEDRHNGPASVHGHLCTLRVFYRLLAHDQVIPFSPAEAVRMPKVWHDDVKIVGLDRMDVMKMLQTSRAMSPDHGALCALLGVLGLRVSEACAVKLEDISEREQGHRVLRLVGKGSKPATMPLPPAVFRVLDAAADGRTGYLLRRLDGVTPLDRRAAARMVRQIAKNAGVTAHVSPHVLRHSFVSAALEAGVPLRDVQVAARHADPRTTSRYDTARRSLDRHAVHVVSAYLSGGS